MKNSADQRAVSHALYMAWKLEPDGADGARSVRALLSKGAERKLYRLRSWMVARGEARALLIPAAPLEEIADALFTSAASPVSTRWIAGQRKCAIVTRQIERAPVDLGLASRPEQWPYSSAWGA